MDSLTVPKNIKNDSELQRRPEVNAWLCISAAVLLYCTQVVNKANARTLFANTFPSETAFGNCRAQHINKNISWVEGTLLSQLCQRCDCEMENMVSLLQKFTRAHWGSVSQARLTRCDIPLPVVSSGSWNSILHFILALTVNVVFPFLGFFFFPFCLSQKKNAAIKIRVFLLLFFVYLFLFILFFWRDWRQKWWLSKGGEDKFLTLSVVGWGNIK